MIKFVSFSQAWGDAHIKGLFSLFIFFSFWCMGALEQHLVTKKLAFLMTTISVEHGI